MSQLKLWFLMGGYADYIWSAYGVFLLIFTIQIIALKLKRKASRKALKLWFKRQEN